MKKALILEALVHSGRTEIKIYEKQELEQSVGLVVFRIFSQAQEELLSGKDPSLVLREFLSARE